MLQKGGRETRLAGPLRPTAGAVRGTAVAVARAPFAISWPAPRSASSPTEATTAATALPATTATVRRVSGSTSAAKSSRAAA